MMLTDIRRHYSFCATSAATEIRRFSPFRRFEQISRLFLGRRITASAIFDISADDFELADRYENEVLSYNRGMPSFHCRAPRHAAGHNTKSPLRGYVASKPIMFISPAADLHATTCAVFSQIR
jgi:hypothetical protein